MCVRDAPLTSVFCCCCFVRVRRIFSLAPVYMPFGVWYIPDVSAGVTNREVTQELPSYLVCFIAPLSPLRCLPYFPSREGFSHPPVDREAEVGMFTHDLAHFESQIPGSISREQELARRELNTRPMVSAVPVTHDRRPVVRANKPVAPVV